MITVMIHKDNGIRVGTCDFLAMPRVGEHINFRSGLGIPPHTLRVTKVIWDGGYPSNPPRIDTVEVKK